MQSFNVKLLFPEARISDLGKLPSLILAPLPGGSTTINVIEKYYKKFAGGLPIDVRLTITDKSILLKPHALTNLLADGINEVEIGFKDIIDVRCVVDKFHSTLNLYLSKSKNIVISTTFGEYRVLDHPDVTTLFKSRAEKITDAINNARK